MRGLRFHCSTPFGFTLARSASMGADETSPGAVEILQGRAEHRDAVRVAALILLSLSLISAEPIITDRQTSSVGIKAGPEGTSPTARFPRTSRKNLMYHHVKKLMYTVRVDEPDPRFGNMLLEQFGGANGELAAAMQYSVQGLNCEDAARKDLLMDIGTEELSHLEIVGDAGADASEASEIGA